MSEVTKAKSVKKPADHKPAGDDFVKVEFKGVDFEVKVGVLGSLRVLDALERNQFTTALRLIVGDAGFETFLAEVPDADADDAGELLGLVAERAGSKNS